MTLNCKLPQPCTPVDVPQPKQPTTPFSLCVGDYSLHWDGTHLTHTRERVTPDGTYGSVTLHDGCVVSYGDCEIPTYTPPYCNPNPVPCSEVGSGNTDTNTVTVSPTAGNTLKYDSFGLFAKTYLAGGTGITVQGDGTQQRPYTISLQGNADGNSGTEATVIGSGVVDVVERNGVSYISLKKSSIDVGKYGPFTISEYGTITAIDNNASILSTSNFKVGKELTLNTLDGDVFLGLAASTAQGNNYRFGGYNVSISEGGRVTGATRAVELDGGTYKVGAYTITFDDFGVVTNIDQDDVPASAGSFKTLDGRTVTYDETGRITDVEGVAQAVTSQGPIHDVWVLSHSTGGRTVDGEFQGIGGKDLRSFWGNTVEALEDNNDRHTARIQLPAYITRAEQVELHRNGSNIMEETLDIANKMLIIRFNPFSRLNGEANTNKVNIVLRG